MSTRKLTTGKRRGQTLPLACVSLLFMALMMMLSFNIANVIHEKIRLQNYSDAQAYSMSTIEARTFNFLAYSNRASAAAFVTIASLHGFYAIANMTPQLYRAAGVAMGFEAILELAAWVASYFTQHGDHIATCVRLAAQYLGQDAQDAEDTLTDWEDPFNDAVDGLWSAVGSIHEEQDMMLQSAGDRVKAGFDARLKRTARHASPLASGVGMLNENNLYSATEGSQHDRESAIKLEEDRAKTYTEIINASRPVFTHDISQIGMDYMPMIGDAWDDLQISMPYFSGGEHAIVDDSCSPEAGAKGEKACGDASGPFFFGMAEDLPGIGMYSGSEIVSDEEGGDHTPDGAHDPDHDKFLGIPKCVKDKDCFINFRIDEDDEKTWTVSSYAYYQQDLTERPKQNQDRPWLLGDDGRVTIEMGKASELVMKPTRTGAAMSHAVTYFHAPGKWPRQPNFFDPFWHAKLHPFDKETARDVIMASGDKSSDAQMAETVIEGAME